MTYQEKGQSKREREKEKERERESERERANERGGERKREDNLHKLDSGLGFGRYLVHRCEVSSQINGVNVKPHELMRFFLTTRYL